MDPTAHAILAAVATPVVGWVTATWRGWMDRRRQCV